MTEPRYIHFSPVEVPADLPERILSRVRDAERLQFRLRMAMSVLGFAVFAGMGVLSWNVLVQEWREGWVSYVQLMATDPDIIASSWQSFVSGFLEVAPVYTVLSVTGFTLLASYFFSSLTKHRIHQRT